MGIGAIVWQEEEEVKHPVAFASKKLLPREQNYSTIAREALAIVWGVQKFQNYLILFDGGTLLPGNRSSSPAVSIPGQVSEQPYHAVVSLSLAVPVYRVC